MKNISEYIELHERKKAGKLKGQALVVFEEDLSKYPEIKAELKAYDELCKAPLTTHYEAPPEFLLRMNEHVEPKVETPKPTPSLRRRLYLLVSTAAASLIIVFFSFLTYDNYNPRITITGPGNNVFLEWEKMRKGAKTQGKEKNYLKESLDVFSPALKGKRRLKKSKRLMQKYILDNPDDKQVPFLYAVYVLEQPDSFLSQDELIDAKDILLKYKNNTLPKLGAIDLHEVLWYLAIAYLKSGDKDTALPFLKEAQTKYRIDEDNPTDSAFIDLVKLKIKKIENLPSNKVDQ